MVVTGTKKLDGAASTYLQFIFTMVYYVEATCFCTLTYVKIRKSSLAWVLQLITVEL
jgi:hypothetical protein